MPAAKSIAYCTNRVQLVSKSPLDIQIIANAIGLCVGKNEQWSLRTASSSEFVARADFVDESTGDHLHLRSFHNAADAVENVPEYVQTIVEATGMSEACLIIAMIFIDRIKGYVSMRYEESFLMLRANTRRLLAVASFLASKCYDDRPTWSASQWASASCIPKDELLVLERHLLPCLVDAGMFVPWQEFGLKRSILEDLVCSSNVESLQTEHTTAALPSPVCQYDTRIRFCMFCKILLQW